MLMTIAGMLTSGTHAQEQQRREGGGGRRSEQEGKARRVEMYSAFWNISVTLRSALYVYHFLSLAEGKPGEFLKNLQSGGCEFLPEFLSEFLSREFQSDSAFKIAPTEIRALIRPVIRLEIRV